MPTVDLHRVGLAGQALTVWETDLVPPGRVWAVWRDERRAVVGVQLDNHQAVPLIDDGDRGPEPRPALSCHIHECEQCGCVVNCDTIGCTLPYKGRCTECDRDHATNG